MFSDLRRILIGDGEPLLWFNRHKIQSESISLTSEAGKNKQKKLFIYTILTQEELWASQIILTFQLDFLLFLSQPIQIHESYDPVTSRETIWMYGR